jgi:DNA-binding NarL/FixJ family response regulator
LLKFLIADDHHLIREGLRYALEGAFQDLHVIEAADGEHVVAAVASEPDIDLILLDYYMPATDGYTLLGTLCDRYPHVPVVIVSGSSDPVLAHKTLERGAAGFLSKTTDHEHFLEALRLVLSGGTYVPPEIGGMMTQPPSAQPAVEPQPELPRDQVLMALTQRQRQVLKLMAQGKTNKDISRELCVSENTVKVHVTAILKALGVSNRTQAVLMAQKLGLS